MARRAGTGHALWRGAWLAALAMAGCATTGPRPTESAPVAHASGHWTVQATRVGGAGDSSGPSELGWRQALDRAAYVFVGERHDEATDHAAQAWVLQELLGTGRPVVIGLEMVDYEAQGTIDAWCAGALDEDALRSQLDWDRAWGFDFAYYRPFFAACRSESAHLAAPLLVALSPPLSSVRQLSRGTGTPDDARLDSATAAHRAYFEAALDALSHAHGHEAGSVHGHRSLTAASLYDAQMYRDETMADRIRAAVQSAERPEAVGLVIAGRGHVEYGLGVPARVCAPDGADAERPCSVVVLPVTGPAEAEIDTEFQGHARADFYVWPAENYPTQGASP